MLRLTARRAAEIEPFEVMDVLSRAHALEAAGRRVVHLEIGEPDFTAPEPVVEAGVRALREGRTAYTATLGLPALREAIAAHYRAKFSATVSPDRIPITPGASLGLPGEVVVINSFSKYFWMTGWRLGWAVLPESAMRGFEKLAQHLFISPPSAAQYAACAAFSDESLSTLEQRRQEFARRRDFLLPALRTAGLAIPAEPKGAFYIYADCGRDAKRFALELLQNEAVAATPGLDFGANATARFVRFAYKRSMEDLEEAATRIARFVCALSA